ncbi:MAG TPA: hypothetical protein EYQ31_09895 [Candidatus Handelsmanbacteria bacterium]|nr:hypothetical protein [Candidatus Handelsmanbacteria bacterium]
MKRFLREEFFPELLKLHHIDCQSSHGLLDLYEFCRESLAGNEIDSPALRPAPLLTGQELLDVGYRPGPRFGQIVRWLEDEQLEERLTTKEQALEAVLGHWAMD